MRRTLEGMMHDSGINMLTLASVLGVSRTTLYRKVRSLNFTLREVRIMISFFHIDDPAVAWDIFLLGSSQ
jgi:hypothetical protein